MRTAILWRWLNRIFAPCRCIPTRGGLTEAKCARHNLGIGQRLKNGS